MHMHIFSHTEWPHSSNGQMHYSARILKNPSRMLQRVAIVISEQKTVNAILMNLQPIQWASAPALSRTSLPSGAPVEHLNVGAILDERWKVQEEKQKRKDNHPTEKSKTTAKNSVPHVKSKKCTAASMLMFNTELNPSRKRFTGSLTNSHFSMLIFWPHFSVGYLSLRYAQLFENEMVMICIWNPRTKIGVSLSVCLSVSASLHFDWLEY